MLMKTFVMSKFSYCSLNWMFHDRNLKKKINRIHDRAHKNNVSSMKTFYKVDNSVNVHQRNLQLFMVEIYKTETNLNPRFMKQIFEEKGMPRCSDKLQLPGAKRTYSGKDMVKFVGKSTGGTTIRTEKFRFPSDMQKIY